MTEKLIRIVKDLLKYLIVGFVIYTIYVWVSTYRYDNNPENMYFCNSSLTNKFTIIHKPNEYIKYVGGSKKYYIEKVLNTGVQYSVSQKESSGTFKYAIEMRIKDSNNAFIISRMYKNEQLLPNSTSHYRCYSLINH